MADETQQSFDNPGFKSDEVNVSVEPDSVAEESQAGPGHSKDQDRDLGKHTSGGPASSSTSNGKTSDIAEKYKMAADDTPKKNHTSCVVMVIVASVVILAIIVLTIYFAEVLEKRNKLEQQKSSHFTGSVRIVGGPYATFTEQMKDKASPTYKYLSETFQIQMNSVFRKSKFQNEYQELKVTQFKPGSVLVHFILKFHRVIEYQTYQSSAYELVTIFKQSLDQDGRLGVFVFDVSSIAIKDTTTLPRPTTTPAPPSPPVILGQCLPISNTSSCADQAYNSTSFPNLAGHNTSDLAETWAVTFTAVLDATFQCYHLVKLFACAVAFPKCANDETLLRIPPCRSLCEATLSRCAFSFPLVEPYVGQIWPASLENCSHLPDSADPDVCVGGEEVNRSTRTPCKATDVPCAGDNTTCISRDWLCDGHVDCEDGSDEQSCSLCGSGEYRCRSGQCIAAGGVCDGRADCYAADDEKSCVSLSGQINGKGTVQVMKDNTTAPLCGEHWNDTDADILCKQLGYSSDNSTWSRENTDSAKPAVFGMAKQKSSHKYLQSRIHYNGSCTNASKILLSCGQKECGRRPAYVSASQRILSGEKVRPGAWPWLVSVHGGPRQAFYCAGTILTDRWVLTAAHCLSKDTITIRAGVMRRDTYSPYLQTLKSRLLVRHPDFDAATNDNDIALVQLTSALRFTDYVQPICLPTNTINLQANEPTTVIGWGKTADGAYDYERVVGEVSLPIFPHGKCQAAMESKMPGVKITANMICAGAVRDRDACSGDSGGPLMHQNSSTRAWTLEGVVSFGASCGLRGVPAVYTNVRVFREWITQTIKNHTATDA